MTYSFPNFEPVLRFMSGSNCCCLSYIQVSQVVWYSHLFKNFPQFVVIHTVKGFSIVNEADFLWNSLALFYDLADIRKLISGSFAFSKFSLYIWKFSVHVLLKQDLDSSFVFFSASVSSSVKWMQQYLA